MTSPLFLSIYFSISLLCFLFHFLSYFSLHFYLPRFTSDAHTAKLNPNIISVQLHALCTNIIIRYTIGYFIGYILLLLLLLLKGAYYFLELIIGYIFLLKLLLTKFSIVWYTATNKEHPMKIELFSNNDLRNQFF